MLVDAAPPYRMQHLARATGLSAPYVSRTGVNALYRRLAEAQADQTVVTGSFAAVDYVQVAAPAQLALYVPNIEDFARTQELLTAPQGADVLLLRAADPLPAGSAAPGRVGSIPRGDLSAGPRVRRRRAPGPPGRRHEHPLQQRLTLLWQPSITA